jgi:hypothetical protein
MVLNESTQKNFYFVWSMCTLMFLVMIREIYLMIELFEINTANFFLCDSIISGWMNEKQQQIIEFIFVAIMTDVKKTHI